MFKYSKTDNLIKLETTNKTKLLKTIEELYKHKTVFSIELQFTDYDDLDIENRYVRCYLVFDSNEDASNIYNKLNSI